MYVRVSMFSERVECGAELCKEYLDSRIDVALVNRCSEAIGVKGRPNVEAQQASTGGVTAVPPAQLFKKSSISPFLL